jgi:hypothetical protein
MDMRYAMTAYHIFISMLIFYALFTKNWQIFVSSFIVGGMTMIADKISWFIILANIVPAFYWAICFFEKTSKRTTDLPSPPSQPPR